MRVKEKNEPSEGHKTDEGGAVLLRQRNGSVERQSEVVKQVTRISRGRVVGQEDAWGAGGRGERRRRQRVGGGDLGGPWRPE